MKLRDLIEGVDSLHLTGDLEKEIDSIHYDSRRIKPGSLFVAIRGPHFQIMKRLFRYLCKDRSSKGPTPGTDLGFIDGHQDGQSRGMSRHEAHKGSDYLLMGISARASL